jgi:uncharacterized membrane protein
MFSREDCHLCEQAEADLRELQAEIPHILSIVDVDQDEDMRLKYGDSVPVILVGPYTIKPPFDIKMLRWKLMAARDGAAQDVMYGGKRYQRRLARRQRLTGGERLSLWIADHYLALLNIFLFLYVGLSFLAPVLMKAGYPGLARPIYLLYGVTCHQMGFRSWFMYGEQAAYPREVAHVEGLVPYGEATGENEQDHWAARSYIGNEEVGYKVAFCQRDVAIYAAMFLFGLLYAASGRRIPPLAWYLWIGIGLVPIGLDGLSQIFSEFLGWWFWAQRESTPLLRTLTGAIFGFTTAWFGFPLVEETMEEARVMIMTKVARLAGTVKNDQGGEEA